MIELHIPLWKLLVYGAALYLIVQFRISGQLLKERLAGRIGPRGRVAAAVSAASDE
jgi:hypothetical protein